MGSPRSCRNEAGHLDVPAAPRLPSHPGDEVGHLVDAGRAGQIGTRILQRERQPEPLARRKAPADLRLPEQDDRVQSLEVDAVGLGLGSENVDQVWPKMARRHWP